MARNTKEVTSFAASTKAQNHDSHENINYGLE